MSMITATGWVRRGVAAQFPERYEIDEAEISRISKLAKVQLESARTDLEAARDAEGEGEDEDDVMETVDDAEVEKESEKKGEEEKKSKAEDEDDELAEYDMEHYDSDPRDEEGEEVTMFGNVQSLAYHQPHEKDPYLVLPNKADGAGDDSDEEREDLQILPSDNLLLAGKVEDEVAHLEVYVYEDEADNLYVHHDVMLPAIPLCVEWLDIPVGSQARETGRSHGNFVAVGTMEPDIEIWDLDVVDCMYPSAILGKAPDDEGKQQQQKKKKIKKKSAIKKNDEYHVDAVLGLAANRQHRNLLASASADCTVKLWDLNDANTTRCAKSYNHHTDKVCSIDWHTKESTVLLSGSYDRSVVACDMRSAEGQVGRWTVPSDVECVRWDPLDSNIFYITTDGGQVVCHDLRTPDSALWTLQAHDSSVSSFDVNSFIPGFLVTGSTDKTVKIWNILDNKPSMVVSRKVEEVGKVFSTGFGPDRGVAFRLAIAGSKGVVKVWDTSTNGAVRRAFATKMAASAEEMGVREGRTEVDGQGMVGVADDEEEDDDSDDEEMA